MVKDFSVVKLLDERGLAPVIGTAVTIAIVFILVGLVSSVFFEDYVDPSHKRSPTAKLQVRLAEDENSLEFEHGGGDPLFFDSSSLSVIMDINDTSYLLNDSALGTLEAGEKKVLGLNESVLSAIELGQGDRVSVKVVDYESGALIAESELEVKGQMIIRPE
jgi:archaeal type IV pilus assembly protein PilA